MRRSARHLALAMMLLALMLSPAGCDDDAVGPGVNMSLDEAERLWAQHGPRSYTYVVQYHYTSIGTTPAVVIDVRNTVVASRRYLGTGQPVEAQREYAYPTMEGLFQRVANAVRGGGRLWGASYHSRLGYPLDISFDYHPTAVDDEVALQVSAFAFLPR